MIRLFAIAAALLLCVPAVAQEAIDQNTLAPSKDPTRTANGLALTPPMGWNSWNKFNCRIDEKTVRAVADGIVSTGMKDAGYTYVVVDDCWHGQRDKDGFIGADPARFPGGMK
ncbi:MAG: glycoside hydrolase family 27 protein, partial [Sphingomonas sp.]